MLACACVYVCFSLCVHEHMHVYMCVSLHMCVWDRACHAGGPRPCRRTRERVLAAKTLIHRT
jgi:hypothetical protein